MSDFVFALDFDGTLTDKDYSVPFLYRFLPGGWDGLDEQFFQGEIGRRDLYEQVICKLDGTRDDHVRYIREKGAIQAGFDQLHNWISRHEGRMWVVSDGIRVAVDALLPHEERNIAVWSNTIFYDDKGHATGVKPDYPADSCRWCSNCKKELLARETGGQKVLFAGDGISDVCAVDVADVVFATGMLVDICRQKEHPCFAWEHLAQVSAFLQAGGDYGGYVSHGLRWHGSDQALQTALHCLREVSQ